MNSTNHIDVEDLALFAMQLLSQAEEANIRRHLELCSECREEVARIMGDLASFALTAEMHSPPAQARDRLLKQVAREKRPPRTADLRPIDRPSGPVKQTVAAQTDTPLPGLAPGRQVADEVVPGRSIPGKVLPWLGWPIAAGLALAAGQLYHRNSELRNTISADHADLARLTVDAEAAHRLMDTMTDPTAMRVTLTRSKQAPVPQGKATYVPEKGSLIFLASNMQPLSPYKVYELWIIPVDGRDPIPAGTFHPDERGNASVIMPDLPKGVPAKAFGITIEDQGGSRTPTMPIIMAGT